MTLGRGALSLWISLAAASAALAQPQDQIAQEKRFDGWQISLVRPKGFMRHPFTQFERLLQTRRYRAFKADDIAADMRRLWETGKFSDVGRKVEEDLPANPGHVIVTIWVVEYPTILNVPIIGARAEDPAQIYSEVLRLKFGSVLNPYQLRLDKQDILNRYRQKGYHFCEVREEITPTGPDVILTWRIFEGPLVEVDEINFEGAPTMSESDIEAVMATKEGGWFSSHPYVEKALKEDIERIKWNYRLEGYLDIYEGNQVFIKEVVFSENKRKVSITIRIEESQRFSIRNIQFKGNTVISGEELLLETKLKPGGPMNEREMYRAVGRIRDAYGERAYISAEVEPQWIVIGDTHEVDILFTINEKQKAKVGRVLIQGNTKTKEDRIRLDLRDDIVPGEEFNVRRLQRALQRLRDRGWFEQSPQGIEVKYEDTELPTVKDVIVSVREGETTRIQFAAGFSSSFGIIGMIEYTQRNFDIGDFPDSFGDIPTSFVGAGQTFRIRLSPGASRQSYSIDFYEPYFFGMNLGFGTSVFLIDTVREAWEEELLGGRISFERRLGRFTSVGINFRAVRTSIFDVEDDAPPSLAPFIGTFTTVSVEPLFIHDTRDSTIIPTEGMRIEAGIEISWKGLGSDYNFTKVNTEYQIHFPLYQTEEKTRHVLAFSVKGGWVNEFRGTESVPINERFFLGGRGTVRGFAFRGIGPEENDVPVGGEVYAVGTIEYTIPLFQQILFGAVWYDAGTLSPDIRRMDVVSVRQSVGFGLRFLVPALGNIPIALDFGWALSSKSGDEEQVVLFDLGRFFQ
jgi:outer membrane protein assembly complex protein YaeT